MEGNLPTEVESPYADESRTTPRSQSQKAPSPPNPRYKSRVRTGCLVCRARKVKCDEQRPTCQKCARLNKDCVYRIQDGWAMPQTPPSDTNLRLWDGRTNEISAETVSNNVSPEVEVDSYPDHGQPMLLGHVSDSSTQEVSSISHHIGRTSQRTRPGDSDDSSPHHSAVNFHRAENHPIAGPPPNRFQETSQLIYLSTVMDWLAASEAPTPSSFTYFIEVVDCPLLSPFDCLTWRRVKQYIAAIGLQQTSVAESLLAVQTLYRAQVDHLPMTHAMSVYQAAITSFEFISGDNDADFGIVLVIAFLLCVCAATLPNEDGSHFAPLDGAFVTRLEAWLQSGHQSPVSLRICAWLQLLNTTTKRPGSVGILSTKVLNLLYKHVKDVPSLSVLDRDTHPEHSLYDAVAAPVFTFYLKLQTMSNRVADVTHYRRSRTTPEDQAEVTDLMTVLRADLGSLWENRPAPLQLQPAKVREHFSAQISDPLITLAGLCIAAFHAEIIIIGRILGDPPFPSPEAQHSLQQIRKTIDGDWNTYANGTLNPGFVRPIFAYALESFQKEESQWAADRLRQIGHPCSRSNFLASFVEAHGEAQRAQSRRVTMKYFCYQTFGVPLPFM